jgi:hypothetical protein
MENNREKAIAWWKQLPTSKRKELCLLLGVERIHLHVSGREIEMLYNRKFLITDK